MMWIDGVDPRDVLHAYAAAVVALAVSGLVAAFQQHAYSPIMADDCTGAPHIDWMRVGIVVAILAAAIAGQRRRSIFAIRACLICFRSSAWQCGS